MINNTPNGIANVRDANPNFTCISIVSAANAANRIIMYIDPIRRIATSNADFFFIIIYLFFISMRWAIVANVVTPAYMQNI